MVGLRWFISKLDSTLKKKNVGGLKVFCDTGFANQSVEVPTISVEIDKSVINVVGVYRPHSSNSNDSLRGLRNSTILKGKKVTLAGDFNINLLNETTDSLSNMFSDHTILCQGY